MTVKLAVIGVGWAGTRHIEAIKELTGHYRSVGKESAPVEVTMLVDPDEAHLASVSGDFGVEKISTQLGDALSDPEIDAVSIATPHANHVESAIAAAQAGKHIAVEKPMAVTVEEADRMIEAANQAGVRLFVAEQVAYGARVETLKRILASGEHVGEPTFISVTAGFRANDYGYPGRRAWLARPAKGGSGTWLLHGVHTVAELRAVFGEVKRVYCTETSSPSFTRTDIEGTMTCLFEMQSGVSVQLVQSCETGYAPERLGTTVFGTEGTLFAGKNGISIYSLGDGQTENHGPPTNRLSDYALEFEAFAEWIEQGFEPPTTGISERGSLAVIQAGYESAKSGLPINIEQRFGKT